MKSHNQVDVDELLALEAKAWPAPWEADTSNPEDCVVWADDGQFLANVGSDRIVPIRPDGTALLFDIDVKNCEFVVAARNAIRPLCLEVKELREQDIAIKAVFAHRHIGWVQGADVAAIIGHTLALAEQEYKTVMQERDELREIATLCANTMKSPTNPQAPIDVDVLAKLSDRELDVLVAERVMGLVPCDGWRRINLGSAGGPAMMQVRDVPFYNPEDLPACTHAYGECFPIDTGYPGSGPAKYSTDDNAARLMRDRIAELGLTEKFILLLGPSTHTNSYTAQIFAIMQLPCRQQAIAALIALGGKNG
jgi:hypothetical protein